MSYINSDMVWKGFVPFRHGLGIILPLLLKVVLVGFEPWTSWSLKGICIPDLYSVYLIKCMNV